MPKAHLEFRDPSALQSSRRIAVRHATASANGALAVTVSTI